MFAHSRKLAFLTVSVVTAAVALSTLSQTAPPQSALGPGGQTMISSIPYTISLPGSYYVSQELVAPASAIYGITITVSDVTLDLNGFRIRSSSALGGSAIALSATAHRVTVRNGIVGPWYGTGVSGPASTDCHVESLTLSNNGTGMGPGGGISLGDRAGVSKCTAILNEIGITVGTDSLLTGCVVTQSGEHGIRTGDRARVVACSSSNNGIGSSYQLTVGSGSTVRDCTIARGAGGIYGLIVGQGCVVSGCSITTGGGDFGFQAGNGCEISNCTVFSLSPQDPVHFISAGNNCSITDCTTTAASGGTNSGIGFRVGRGCVVTNCSASGGFMGISTASAGSRLEGNRISNATTGISVTSAGNIVLRNAVTGGGGYAISAGNSYGPIVSVAGAGDISTVPNANHPWANFRY